MVQSALNRRLGVHWQAGARTLPHRDHLRSQRKRGGVLAQSLGIPRQLECMSPTWKTKKRKDRIKKDRIKPKYILAHSHAT
jgi:hypothetical protein